MYYTVSSEVDDEDGIYIKQPGKDDPAEAILDGKGKYQNLVFNEVNNKMLFLTDRDDQGAKTPSFTLYSWKMNDDNANLVIDPKSTPGFPGDMQLAASGLRWSKDDKSAFFNISERKKEEPEEDEEADDEEKAKVIIWHWKDSQVKPREQARVLGKTTGSRHVGGGRREQTFQAVYHIEDEVFLRLTDENIQSVSTGPNDKYAVGTDPVSHLEENPWSITIDTQRDYYLVDLKDGSKKTLEIETHWGYQWSNEGNYLLQYAQPHWFVYDIATGEKRNLTENLDEAFWNTDDDHPDYKRAWGIAGWTKDDEGVLIYDKYDLWYFPIKKPGQPVNVTMGLGRKTDARFRYQRVDPEEEFIDVKKPVWLNYFDNKTKASGLYEVKFENEPAKVYVVDKGMRFSRKAKDADVYMFTMSTYFDYGDLYISDRSLTNVRKLTDANPENNGLHWGKAQLIEYTNQDGVKLQGILSLPENYEPGRKYPMIIYFYEKLTQGLHNWRAPSTGSGFSAPYFNSRGYVVLQPDIIYTDGYPGPSSVKCVVPAAQKVIDMGIADPNSIAITGHSWGGYQTAYIVTQTDMFACAYAGAPVSNMTSAYGGIRWASGMNRAHQYERTQSRIGGSIWEYPERYIENSPLFFADRVNTPIMLLHGDEDGAVPWYQSIEYYIGLRRNNKPVWFLQYETEPHGLRGDANKKDFTIRRDEFFDHYLMGKPMPKWMSEGMKIGEDPTKR
jgi:dienelactone hydrolase